MKKPNIWTGFTLVILCFFLLFVVYPLFLIMYQSVVDPETHALTFDYFTKFFGRKFYWSTLVNSFKVTVCATLLAAIIGLPMAYVLRSFKIPYSKYVNILIVISYLSPPFIGAYAWIQLLGRNGFITQLINSLFGIQFGGIYGFAGIVLVFSLQSFPLIYMYVSGALKNLDSSLNEAAESLGCNAFQRVTRIILPLVMPSLLAGSLLVFMRVFSDFGTPMLIGEGFKTFPVLIYTQFMGEVSTDDHFAAALCVIVVVITLFLFFLQRMMAKHYSYAMTALKPMQPVYAKGSQKFFAYLFVYGVASFLETVGGAVYTGKFSFMNYENTLFSKDNISIFNTYAFGLCAICIVVVLGILISYLTARKPSLLTNILDTLTMFPYIIPGSVLGIALLSGFNSGILVLSGTALIIIISLTIRRMPYTIRSSTAIISQISPSVEEAAISLGASEFKSFRKIMVPMMLPGVLAGAIMSWITLISELSSSIILYTSSTSTLTVAIYAEVIRSNFGNAAAYSTILTLTSIVSLLIFFRLTHNEDVSV